MPNDKKKTDRYEVRLAGEGGQGLILAGIILAEAAALHEGKNVVQTQAYGPEARGGASKAEVVISSGPIYYPKVIVADLLLAMSQQACDKYCHELKEDGIVVVDSGRVGRVYTSRAYHVPITALAAEEVGSPLTANVLALGLVTGLTGVVSPAALEEAVSSRVPPKTRELNLKALQKGLSEAERVLSEEKRADANSRLEDWYRGISPPRLG